MHERALARAARPHHRQHLARLHVQIDVMQHDRRVFRVLIGKRNVREPDGTRKLRHPLRSRLLPHFVFDIHETENFRRRSHRLLEIIVKDRELAHRVVELEHRHNESQKSSRRENVVADLVPAHEDEQRNGNRTENIHQRRTDGERRHQSKIRVEQASRGGAEASYFPVLHAKRLDDPVAGNRLVQNVLDLGQLILAAPCGAAYLPADFSGRVQNGGNEQQQHPSQLPSKSNHYPGQKYEGKKLLQEFRQHTRHRVLHFLDIVDDGREQCAGGVFREKCRRTPQDGVIQIVPQVGDHAKAGVVYEESSDVIEDPLQYRGCHQREGNHRPRIVEVGRNQLLEIEKAPAAGQLE